MASFEMVHQKALDALYLMLRATKLEKGHRLDLVQRLVKLAIIALREWSGSLMPKLSLHIIFW
ncbi:MAG: hypothetical protein BWK76_18140 [Desulfobulbaceae bacterium A2]|nr:MAG: hypothetical protein BWK76_18140 [Desulfobulbaceae bacterium A2]